VHAVVAAESAFNIHAVSPAGAVGLMQLMPATALDYGVSSRAALFDPSTNIDAGVRHLKRLLRKYRGDYGRVIMAYNAGEGVVDRTNGNVRYPETLNYTEAVVRRYRQLGGKEPTGHLLRKVSVLRQRPKLDPARNDPAPPSDPFGALPTKSEQLNATLPNSLLDDGLSSPASAQGKGRITLGQPDPPSIGGLRRAIDPVIRDAARVAPHKRRWAAD
jgi:hypothetical protein